MELVVFCCFCVTHFEAKPLSFHQTANDLFLLSDDPFFSIASLGKLSIAFEIVQHLHLNNIIYREATDVFFSLAIFVISHQFRCIAQVQIKFMPAEIKLLSHVCQENA